MVSRVAIFKEKADKTLGQDRGHLRLSVPVVSLGLYWRHLTPWRRDRCRVSISILWCNKMEIVFPGWNKESSCVRDTIHDV